MLLTAEQRSSCNIKHSPFSQTKVNIMSGDLGPDIVRLYPFTLLAHNRRCQTSSNLLEVLLLGLGERLCLDSVNWFGKVNLLSSTSDPGNPTDSSKLDWTFAFSHTTLSGNASIIFRVV